MRATYGNVRSEDIVVCSIDKFEINASNDIAHSSNNVTFIHSFIYQKIALDFLKKGAILKSCIRYAVSPTVYQSKVTSFRQ